MQTEEGSLKTWVSACLYVSLYRVLFLSAACECTPDALVNSSQHRLNVWITPSFKANYRYLLIARCPQLNLRCSGWELPWLCSQPGIQRARRCLLCE